MPHDMRGPRRGTHEQPLADPFSCPTPSATRPPHLPGSFTSITRSPPDPFTSLNPFTSPTLHLPPPADPSPAAPSPARAAAWGGAGHKKPRARTRRPPRPSRPCARGSVPGGTTGNR